MNSKHKKTLQEIFSNPLNGNVEWCRIEALLKAVGCDVIEGAGASVTFARDGHKAFFHRPHPQNAALRYRVKEVRHFLCTIGVTL